MTRTAEEEEAVDLPPEVVKQRTMSMFLWIGIYLLGIWLIGFSPATLIVSVLYLKLMGERWLPTVVLSLCNFAFVYGLFEQGLGVPFPPGQLMVWLGLGG